jgi:hypothetical protein
VSVVDLTGQPLANVTLLANRVGTSDVELNATATTDAAGQATFDLYEDTWSIRPETSLGDINPAGTGAGPSSESSPHGHGYDYGYSQCLGGTVGRTNGWPQCVVDLTVGKRSKSRVTIKASVAPVDVSLAAGLGLGTVLLMNVSMPHGDFLNWTGGDTHGPGPRSQLHFEVSLFPSGKPVPATWEVIAYNNASHFAPVSVCSPGRVMSDLAQQPSKCDLLLGGGVVQGAVSFALPSG